MGKEHIRIGVFYDGSYFHHMSNHLINHNQTNTHIDLKKFNKYIHDSIASSLRSDNSNCFIVGGHYFRGKFIEPTPEQELFYNRVEMHLYNAGITAHYLPIQGNREKGVDVELALTALEESMLKMYDVIALVAGDEDFVPLVRKISKHGVRTVLFCFDNPDGSTKASWLLSEAVFDTYEMHTEVAGSRNRIPDIFADVSARKKEIGDQIVVPSAPVAQDSVVLPRSTPLRPDLVSTILKPRTSPQDILRNLNEQTEHTREVAARGLPTVKHSSPVASGYTRTQVNQYGYNFGFLEHPNQPQATVYMNPRSFRDPEEYSSVSVNDIIEYRLVVTTDAEGKTLYNAKDARRVVL